MPGKTKMKKYTSEKQEWLSIGYEKAVKDFNRKQLYKGIFLGTIATASLFAFILSLG
jgi:hypothetical protein